MFSGGPSLAYTKELAKEQLYEEHVDSFTEKFTENDAALKSERNRVRAARDKLLKSDKLGLRRYDVLLEKLDREILLLDKLKRKAMTMHTEILQRRLEKLGKDVGNPLFLHVGLNRSDGVSIRQEIELPESWF